MFRTKKDVERHVSDVLSKIDNENEKLLRGFTIARMFYNVKDFDNAKKYLSGFLSVRDHHAASHKLMAQIYEATNNLENALQSYKRSLEIDSHQNDIVLKICELYTMLPVDHETARYWADRAEQLFPHNDIVFKLRECIVSAEGEPDRQELENLIATELAAQPKNIDLRIKLLRLYLDTERVKEAYDHATMIESKKLFQCSADWYYLLSDIFEAYLEEFGSELDSQFYIHYLTALDHLIFLSLAEPHAYALENGRKPFSTNDAAAVLLTFDQMLKKAAENGNKDGPWTYFIHHMKGQLYYHMVSLLIKRAKMDQGNRKEALRFSAGLALVCYSFKPMNLLHEIWFSQMEDNQKTFTNFFQQGALRTSSVGHLILNMCKDDKSSWLQKIKQDVCVSQVKERIYSRMFSSVIQKEKLLSSYFILDSTFEQCSLEFPCETALKEYDKSAFKLRSDSLHHLIWLELNKVTCSGVYDDTLSEVFKNLQYGTKNLSKGSCESLCVLDLEAYLYASVYQAKVTIEGRNSILNIKNRDSHLLLLPDIADPFCARLQAKWWKAAHGLCTCTIKEKLGEHRRNLQHGLEVIRGIGNHGMEVQLVVHLARKFAEKADELTRNMDTAGRKLNPENVSSLRFRSIHYWNIALGMLEKLSSGQTPRVTKEPMFVGCGKALSKSEIKSFQEEGQLYHAVQLMDADKLDEAAELLSKLSSPYGSYYLALTLKKLASQESKPSNARIAFLHKAKTALHETMDRIKDDKSHPLNKEIFIELEDVENELASDIVNQNNSDDIDETDSYDEPGLQNSSVYITPEMGNSVVHSTPRPSSKFMKSRIKLSTPSKDYSQHFEPSPERLDAQIRALALNQDTLVKTFLQQQHTLLETNKSIVEALNQNKDVVEQLKKQLDDLNLSLRKCSSKSGKKKAGYIKGQGDEEEDYNDYDPNNLLDFYGEDGGEEYRTAGYSYDPSSRIVHDAAAAAAAPLNYVVSPALPPGPPPPLNHYNYQYPPHVLPAPPPAVAERPPFYHPPPGQGLPFSEGQQLPQFHFHVASSVMKPPPVMSNVASIPHAVSGVNLPPPPVSLPPPPSVIQPPTAGLPVPSPWSKTVGVPHAFQIPLPTGPFLPAANVPQTKAQVIPSSSSTVVTTQSELKNLLQTPTSATVPFGHTLHLGTTAATTTLNSSPLVSNSHTKTPENAKVDRSLCNSDNIGSPDIDGHDLEREVMGDFKPLIPLPAEIVVETGEENELAFFEDRAKLYRFVDQEWKERGVGIVKILQDEGSGRVRLLMRRDQVLKVCANHYITSNMEIHPLKNSDKAWTWVAQDFADEELKPEHFCIRFKTPEIALTFKAAFLKAISMAKDTEAKKAASPNIKTTITSSPVTQKGFGMKFLPKSGSWTCPTCYVSNAGDKLLCVACETKKPGSQVATSVTSTNVSVSSEIKSIFSSAMGNQFSFNIVTSSPSTGEFFTTKSSTVTTVSTPKSVFGGFTFSSSPMICETNNPDMKEREILVVSTKSKNGPQVTKVSTEDDAFSDFNTPRVPKENTTKESPFSGFSFKSVISSPSSLTSPPADSTLKDSSGMSFKTGSAPSASVTSESVDNSSKSSPFSQFSFKSITTTTSSLPAQATPGFTGFSLKESSGGRIHPSATTFPVQKPESATALSTSSDNSIMKMQNMLQTINSQSSNAVTDSKITSESSVSKITDMSSFNASGSLFVQLTANGRRVSTEGVDGAPEEFVPTAEFKPVVPMPALVDVKTGEEEEEKIFVERAKLFRYDSESKEWKERGIGEIKILKTAKPPYKYRILMRREQVLKTCANHYILPDMKLTPLSSSDRAWVWFAQDFSDGECKQEQFAVKFKSIDIAQQFFNAVQKCQSELKATSDKTPMSNPCAGNKATFEQLFKPVPNWECSVCNKSNVHISECVYCHASKTNNSASSASVAAEQKPLSELFKPDANAWECQTCYVRNMSSDTRCVACETSKPGVNGSKAKDVMSSLPLGNGTSIQNKTQTLGELFKPEAGSWECSVCYVRNSADENMCVACETKNPNFCAPSVITSNNLGKFQFGSGISATSSTQPPAFSFGAPKTSASDFVFGMRPATQPTTFSFGLSTVSTKGNTSTEKPVGFKPTLSVANTPAVFGGTTQKSDASDKSASTLQTSTVSPSVFNFGAPATPTKTESDSVEFRFGSPQKYEFNFSGVRTSSPTKTPKSPKSPASPSDAEDDDEADSSDADSIYFQPAIPLPPKVDVKTGEENEQILFCKRAKLFRFSCGEWKERGIGDIKILYEESLRKVRLLMRRDQVLKVCLNHYITKDISFEWRGDKSLTWAANDFSEGEPSPELFAIRFKTNDLAEQFKAAVESSSELVKEVDTPSDRIASAAATFSFKSDVAAKTDSSFGAGSLSSRFGTSVGNKSVFGNVTDIEPSPFSFHDKAGSTFFSQNANFSVGANQTIFGGHGLKFDAIDKELEEEDEDDIEIAYQAQATPEQIQRAKQLLLPDLFYLFENKPPCPGCRGCEEAIPEKVQSVNKEAITSASDVPAVEEKSSVKSLSSDSEQPNFLSKSGLSFADLAADSAIVSLSKISSKKIVFAGAGTPVFSNLNSSADGDEETVAQGPDIHFEPVIPLPELVAVKTGEEDETPIFVNRAKLFRYDSATKQWKERGVGDIKILQHKHKLRFRIILRRDQVHKIACNHSITEDMELSPMATSDSALCWNAIDYSESQAEASHFAVRFKYKEQLDEFREKFNECKEKLKNRPSEPENEAAAEGKSEHSPDSSVIDIPASCAVDDDKSESSLTLVPDSTTENPDDAHNNSQTAESESNEVNSDEETDEDDLIYEKRVSFEIYDETKMKYESVGMGRLQILYDDSVFGYRIVMLNDKDVYLCDHVIAIQTCLRTDKKKAVWAAIDLSIDPPKRRQFRATFSSVEALNEFSKCFEEGKEAAMHSEIVEKSDDFLTLTMGN